MLIVGSVLLVFLLVITCLLLSWSPGEPKPFLNEKGEVLPGSISEKIRVTVNGAEQGMFIKSRNKENPVLLFIHGGPGMPEYFLAQDCPFRLEDDFTVCYWEQRGAGLSYSPGLPAGTLTEEQLISDTLEVTDYLCRRFGRDKIYLMAHSWGTFLAIQAAARAPEKYIAYIGMAQVSQPLASEKLAYEYMMEQYAAARDGKMVRKLEKFPITELDFIPGSYRGLRDEVMHKLGIGTTHAMTSVISGIFLPSWRFPEYTLSEKINLWRGKWSEGSTDLWNKMIASDVTAKVQKLEIPVYFLHGIHDYTCNYTLAKDYFEKLKVPSKGFYTFEQSAHSPLFEEPGKTRRILREDILAGTTRLADEPA